MKFLVVEQIRSLINACWMVYLCGPECREKISHAADDYPAPQSESILVGMRMVEVPG